jgi:hypothetical protein
MDPAAWSPARCGTAIGKLVSLLVVRSAARRPSTPALRSQQRWQNASELVVASVLWCALPPAIAASLVAPTHGPVAARILFWAAVPVMALFLVQISIFVVGALVYALRRIGLLRSLSDGHIQVLAWGTAGTALAVLGAPRGGISSLLSALWIGLLLIELLARLAVFVLRRRISEVERSLEVTQ